MRESEIDRSNCASDIHGTGHAYRRKGCRCPDTMAEVARAQKEYRDRKRRNEGYVLMDPTETHRMLKALFTAGYTGEMLSPMLGNSTREGAVQLLRAKQVHPTTYAKVRALYERLQHQPGPSERTAGRSARKGWGVPFAWDEETISDPEAAPNVGPAEKKNRQAIGVMYEYQRIRDSGMGHEYALRELGMNHKAWEAAKRSARK